MTKGFLFISILAYTMTRSFGQQQQPQQQPQPQPQQNTQQQPPNCACPSVPPLFSPEFSRNDGDTFSDNEPTHGMPFSFLKTYCDNNGQNYSDACSVANALASDPELGLRPCNNSGDKFNSMMPMGMPPPEFFRAMVVCLSNGSTVSAELLSLSQTLTSDETLGIRCMNKCPCMFQCPGNGDNLLLSQLSGFQMGQPRQMYGGNQMMLVNTNTMPGAFDNQNNGFSGVHLMPSGQFPRSSPSDGLNNNRYPQVQIIYGTPVDNMQNQPSYKNNLYNPNTDGQYNAQTGLSFQYSGQSGTGNNTGQSRFDSTKGATGSGIMGTNSNQFNINGPYHFSSSSNGMDQFQASVNGNPVQQFAGAFDHSGSADSFDQFDPNAVSQSASGTS